MFSETKAVGYASGDHHRGLKCHTVGPVIARTSEKENALNPLSPREIQFRVRAGETPELIAASTGWPLDRVIRYAEPPLGERAYVAERAQKTYVHSTRGGATLLEMVQGFTDSTDLEWDSFYREGQWVVTAAMPGESAVWNFEPTGNTVHPLNDTARSWMGVEPVQSPTAAVENYSDTVVIETSEPVRLMAVPELEIDSELVDDESQSTLRADTESAPPVAPQVAKKTKRGRAKVPSWDEILFGGPKESP